MLRQSRCSPRSNILFQPGKPYRAASIARDCKSKLLVFSVSDMFSSALGNGKSKTHVATTTGTIHAQPRGSSLQLARLEWVAKGSCPGGFCGLIKPSRSQWNIMSNCRQDSTQRGSHLTRPTGEKHCTPSRSIPEASNIYGVHASSLLTNATFSKQIRKRHGHIRKTPRQQSEKSRSQIRKTPQPHLESTAENVRPRLSRLLHSCC